MNKTQNDLLKMFGVTLDVCSKQQAVWITNIPFKNAVQELADNITAINNLRTTQETDNSGITGDKKSKRRVLEEQAITVSGIVTFYATSADDNELLIKGRFGKSMLSKARDNELVGMCEQLHQAAADNAAVLLPYGLTGIMITEFADLINEFTRRISSRKEAKTGIAEATKQITLYLKRTRHLLRNRLDKGIEIYKSTAPKFYPAYHKARRIVKSVVQRRALKAQFIDEQSTIALKGVVIIIGSRMRKKSGNTGSIYVQSLKQGKHSLKAVFSGYENVSHNFNIISGKTTKLEIRMEKVQTGE